MIDAIIILATLIGAAGIFGWLLSFYLLCAAIDQDRNADTYKPRPDDEA